MVSDIKTKRYNNLKVALLIVCGLLLLLATSARFEQEHDHEAEIEHDHDHEEASTTCSENHEHEHETDQVQLKKTDRELAGIVVDKVRAGYISRTLELPGTINLNQDRVVQIRPRFSGIVHKLSKGLGDHVIPGEDLAVIESNESLTTYKVSSFLAGTVIAKNVAPGVYVSEDTILYTIADLSTVWVDFTVYVNNTAMIQKGRTITISQIGNDLTTTGTISFISSVVDYQTQSIVARAVIPNPDSRWKPGTFVKGEVWVNIGEEGPLIAREALQILHDETVVFVPASADTFIARPVKIGEAGGSLVRIIEGLAVGDDYVSQGGFELKATIVTSTLDSHAGHGH